MAVSISPASAATLTGPVAHCMCDRHLDCPDPSPCAAIATQEDFLCDACRPGGCAVIGVVCDAREAGGELLERRKPEHVDSGEVIEIIKNAAGWGV